MLLEAARRFLVLLLIAGVVTTVLSLALGTLAGASVDRSVSLGFYLVGSFLLVSGFFVGNRGPLRMKDPDAAVSPLPFWGSRVVRWASPEEQSQTISLSAVFVALGFVLILIGIAVDSRYSLI
jgi:hypothetical protein